MKIRNVALTVLLFFTVLFTSCNNGIIGDTTNESDPIVESRSTAVRGNLLTNPSFENGNIAPWEQAGGAIYIGSESNSGSKSLRLPFTNQRGVSHYARVDITDKVKIGNLYYFEASGKIEGRPGRGARFFAYVGSEKDTKLNINSRMVFDNWTQSSWYKQRGCFSYSQKLSDSGKVYLYVVAGAGGGSATNAFIDDVYLQDMGVESLKPFPQNDSSVKGTIPSGKTDYSMNTDIQKLYDEWKSTHISPKKYTNGAKHKEFEGFVLRGEANGNTDLGQVAVSQSEATGYAMIMMALMAKHDPEARMIFDKMYQLYINFPSSNNSNLMSWAIPLNGDLGKGNRRACATDGDMDVAYALLMANDQWGGGPLMISDVDTTYYDAAIKIIDAMKDSLIYQESGPHFPRLGDSDDEGWIFYERRVTRSSDFMIGHCQLFNKVTGDKIWSDVADTMIKISEHIQDENTGLMPDFMWNEKDNWGSNIFTKSPGFSDEKNGKHDGDYYWNACRYPFRIALAHAHGYNVNGTNKILKRLNNWMPDLPKDVKGGYKLDGTALVSYNSTAFSAPMMASLMISGDSTKMQKYWDHTKVFENADQWSSYYFQNTIKLLTMNIVSGNWWKPSGVKKTRAGGQSSSVEQWQANAYYKSGDIVSYSGSVWKNSYPHTSNSAWYPGASGLWFWTKQ